MMKSTILKSVLLCSLVASLVALPVLFAADGKVAPTESAVAESLAESLADTAAETLADNAMSIDEQGRLELAGVISVRIDDSGEATVELKRNGDSELDPVLALTVPIFEGGDGRLVAGGIQRIIPGSDTVTLIIAQSITDPAQQNAGSACATYVPLPPEAPNPYCSGECSLESDTCGWVIVDDGSMPGTEGANQRPLPDMTDMKPALTCDCA